MEHIASYVLIIGLLIFTAHFFTAVFRKTNIPDVLPLIIIGILIGPLLKIATPEDFGHVGSLLSAIALALMLFEGGSHLKFDTLLRSLKDCVKLSTATFIITILITTLFLRTFMGRDLILSMFAGIILGSISPAVVVPIVKLLNVSDNTKTTLVVESAITDVLSIVLALSIIKGLQSGSTDLMHLLGTQLVGAIAMSLIFGFIGSLVWSVILKKIRKFPNTIFTTLAFIFILYGLAEVLGYNGPVTILIFGLILANSGKIPLNILKQFGTDEMTEFTNIEKTLFSEIIFIVKTFFFVYLGLSIEFSQTSILLNGLILTVIIYACRYILTKLLGPKEITSRESNLISFIIPKGLAAAVLADIPMHMNFPQQAEFETIRSIVYSVIFFSILLSTVLIYIEESK